MEKEKKNKKKKKNGKWMKFRHKVVRSLLWVFIKPLAVAMYNSSYLLSCLSVMPNSMCAVLRTRRMLSPALGGLRIQGTTIL